MSLSKPARHVTIDSLPPHVIDSIVLTACLIKPTHRYGKISAAISFDSNQLSLLSLCRPFHHAALYLLERYIPIKDYYQLSRVHYHFMQYPERTRLIRWLDVGVTHFFERDRCENDASFDEKMQLITLLGQCTKLDFFRMFVAAQKQTSVIQANLWPSLRMLSLLYHCDPTTLPAHQKVTGRQPEELEHLHCFTADYLGYMWRIEICPPPMPACLRIFDASVHCSDYELAPALSKCVNLVALSMEVPEYARVDGLRHIIQPFAHRLKWLGLHKEPCAATSAPNVVNDLAPELPALRVLACDAVFVDFAVLTSQMPLLRAMSVKEYSFDIKKYNRHYFCCSEDGFDAMLLGHFLVEHPLIEHMAVKRFDDVAGPELDRDVRSRFPMASVLARPSELSNDDLEWLTR